MTVLELLDSPEKWTQCSYARNAQGDRVEPNDPTACRWCLSGAISRIYGDAPGTGEPYKKVRKVIGGVLAISFWNDMESTTFEKVQDVIRRAGV